MLEQISKMIRTGECNHCGKCCLREGGLMVENPMIELHEDRCKFYMDRLKNQEYGHCLIFSRGKKPIEIVKDRYGNNITPKQIKWFGDNCVNYPTAEDVEAGHNLLSECSFKFEKKITEVVTEQLDKMNVAKSDDITDLREQIQELRAMVEKLQKD